MNFVENFKNPHIYYFGYLLEGYSRTHFDEPWFKIWFLKHLGIFWFKVLGKIMLSLKRIL